MQAFNQRGLKFTMDDIAHILGISKKTIYQVFADKEALFLAMVDYLFDCIKESEREVMADESLGTLEKIRKILGVMPESYKEIDFRQMYLLKDKFPEIYHQVELRLETGWEEGVIRRINIPVLKMMLEASLEQFFQRDILIQSKLSYGEALEEVVNILVDGIITRQ